MRPVTLLPCALTSAVLFLAGCTTRSISNSSFSRHAMPNSQIGGYSGELSELDVIGVNADTAITEADIAAAVRNPAGTKLNRASKVLLIQSGADFPDAPMLEAMQRRRSRNRFDSPRRAAATTKSSATGACWSRRGRTS